jgi:transcriptional regulator GlxA family with amidase domain
VTTIAETKTVNANGLSVNADQLLDIVNLPDIDVLLVPGGMGTVAQSENPKVINWIAKLAPSLRFIISVCTGVQLLGTAGLIDNATVTTHHMCYDMVQPSCPKSKMCKCRRYVDNGKILTSAGISAGIDVAYHFIRKLYGSDAAVEVGRFMEYDWKNEAYKEKCECS